MFWYYKVPLIIILVLIVLGIGVLGWRKLVAPRIQKEKQTTTQSPSTTDSDNEQGQALKPPMRPPRPTPPISSTATPATPPTADSGKKDAAPSTTPSVSKPTSNPPTTPAASATQSKTDIILAEAEKAILEDKPLHARELAQAVIESGLCTEFDKTWTRAAETINEANKVFMNSKAPCPEKKFYTVKKGDALTTIAYRNQSTVGGLQRMNELNRTSALIIPGDKFSYISGTWSIRVSKSRFRLMLMLDGKLYRIYQISTGRQDRTPAGTFVIKDKAINPAWTPPGKSIPYGDPQNILGTRWMGLRPKEGTDQNLTGYGIHGTTEPDTIGSAASLGCIRMRNEEVEELFDFIPLPSEKNQTVVVIEE